MRGRALLVVSLILVALNLRPALSSVAPVLPEIMRDTGLSAAGAGLLTTAPVLCLGLFGPLAPVIGRWMRSERVVFLFLAVLAVGLLVRGLGTIAALLIGSGLIGIAIGIVNVLLPVLIKKDFSGSPALMTGVYTMALSTGAALASGLTVPLSKLMDGSWSSALAVWVVPVLVAMVVWMPRLTGTSEASLGSRVALRGIWTNALAWQVTLFMGLQSALAYCVFGWLAPILRDRGMSDVSAGALVSVSIIAQVVAALVTPVLATRGRDQRPAVVICMMLNMAGLLGCVLGSAVGSAALGRDPRPRSGRVLRAGTDPDRLALGRCTDRRPALEHGPRRRLLPGGGRAAARRRATQLDRQLVRARRPVPDHRHGRPGRRSRRRANAPCHLGCATPDPRRPDLACRTDQADAGQDGHRHDARDQRRARCRRRRGRRWRPSRWRTRPPRRWRCATRSGGGGSGCAWPGCGTRAGWRWPRRWRRGCRRPRPGRRTARRTASATTKGAKTRAMAPMTASIFARRT